MLRSGRAEAIFAHAKDVAIWTGMARPVSAILCSTLLGLILDSTGFAKPKVHAEVR